MRGGREEIGGKSVSMTKETKAWSHDADDTRLKSCAFRTCLPIRKTRGTEHGTNGVTEASVNEGWGRCRRKGNNTERPKHCTANDNSLEVIAAAAENGVVANSDHGL